MTTIPDPRFTNDTLAFLRALKRHNDREWFREHREAYDERVLAPMLAVIERLARDLPRFAPHLVVSPKVALYRVYRDTRFSADKTPLKTHVAANFPCRGLAKHEGAGLYFEVAPGHCWIGGGMYAPQSWQLRLVREQIAARPAVFRRIVESRGSAVPSGSWMENASCGCPPGSHPITRRPSTEVPPVSSPAGSSRAPLRHGLPSTPGCWGSSARSRRSPGS